jgi:hypothetical protein
MDPVIVFVAVVIFTLFVTIGWKAREKKGGLDDE